MALPRIVAILAFSTLASLAVAYADEAQDRSQVLKEITDTADRICGSISQSGQSTGMKVTGDVKAELGRLAKVLADLGMTGTGEITSQSYEGVLQNDLASTLRDIMQCKLKVLNSLRQMIFRMHDFEDVGTWSVSVKVGGLLAAGPLDFGKNILSYVLGLPECRFYNLSTTQRRMIDLRLTIPTKDLKDPLGPSITLTTETLDFGFKRTPTPGIISLPIVLEPSSSLEGRVDFLVPEDIGDRIRQDSLKWLKYWEAAIDVTEHRSGKTIRMRAGESYDAATQNH